MQMDIVSIGDVPGIGVERIPASAIENHEYAGSLLQSDSEQLRKHYADLSDVIVIAVPMDTEVSVPVRLEIHPVRAESATHIVILVGERSRVTFVEEATGGQDATWSHGVEIIANDEAQIEYISLQNVSATVRPTIWQRSSIGAGATVHWHNTSMGGMQVVHQLLSTAVGQHATSSVDWIFYAKGIERQTLSATNSFQAGNGAGEITMKGVAEQKGHTVCNGMIEIGGKGTGTDTYLTEEVLMLDKTAKVDAIPGLEIKTNDVKASHSATVSRVTEEDLFYFAARGIDFTEARRMYIEGFLSDLTERILDSTAKETVRSAIAEKYVIA